MSKPPRLPYFASASLMLCCLLFPAGAAVAEASTTGVAAAASIIGFVAALKPMAMLQGSLGAERATICSGLALTVVCIVGGAIVMATSSGLTPGSLLLGGISGGVFGLVLAGSCSIFVIAALVLRSMEPAADHLRRSSYRPR